MWKMSTTMFEVQSVQSKMKILMINPSCWTYGGAEKVLVSLCNWLTENHHTVSLITTQICEEVKNNLKDTRVIFCKDLDELQDTIQFICFDFDVLHIHNEPAYLTVYPRSRNVVWSCNEPPHLHKPEPTPKEKMIVQNFKAITADEFNRKRLKCLYGIDSTIINYPVDYKFFSKVPTKSEIKKVKEEFEIDKPFIIQAGFIAETKNQLETVDIFKKVRDKVDCKLLLVGHPTKYIEDVKRKVEGYRLIGDVSIHKFVSREKLRVLYYLASASLMPLNEQGGWLSVFESISAGVPTFVSERATCSSILKEKKVGHIIDKNTPKKIVSYIKKDEKIKPKFVDELTIDKYCKEVMKVYEKFR